MNILLFDLEKYGPELVQGIVNYLNTNGFEVLAMPKDFDLLLDCDTYTLNLFKEKIENALREKEIIAGEVE